MSSLWLALNFPQLAVTAASGGCESESPLAVTWKDRIHQVNPAARSCGINPGLRPSAALAQLPTLSLVPRRPERETALLQQLAAWCYQFTDRLHLWSPQVLVLEVAGSLKLFGSLAALQQTMADGLSALGHRTQMATTLSARGARLLSLWSDQPSPCNALDRRSLWQAFKPLPLPDSDLEPPAVEALAASGIHTLGQLLQQPRAGLHKRFGSGLIAELDELTGQRPCEQPRYRPPQQFEGELAFTDPVVNTEALRFPLRRLLSELCGCLRGLDCTTQQIEFCLRHPAAGNGHGKPELTRLPLGLASPSQEMARWEAVLGERLNQWQLPAPVVAIHLSAAELIQADGDIGDLFGGSDRKQDRLRLLERLQQRVEVKQLAPRADHRPEYSWAEQDVSESRGGPVSQNDCSVNSERPLWLLPEPKPIPAPPSQLQLAGPERIESGWWDGDGCRRDYYRAWNPDGRLLWLFQDLNENRWYLHGYFF